MNESLSREGATRGFFIPVEKSDGFMDYSNVVLDFENFQNPYNFEKFDWQGWFTFVHRHWEYPIYANAIYLALIFGSQHIMRNRKAFDLRRELFLWNLGLGIFSMLGFYRLLQAFIPIATESEGLHNYLCKWRGISIPTLFWGFAFTLSKFVELGDTLFIVLRKRPLQFLHCFHHVVTVGFTWLVLPSAEPLLRVYGLMNFFIHSVMYPYFALRALDVKIPRKLANIITTLQMLQMFLGLGVNVYTALSFWISGTTTCYRSDKSISLSFFAYGSFIILFTQLFFRLVLRAGNKTSKSPKKQQ